MLARAASSFIAASASWRAIRTAADLTSRHAGSHLATAAWSPRSAHAPQSLKDLMALNSQAIKHWSKSSVKGLSSAAGSAPAVDAAVLRKARRMSPPVGLIAGVFGSLVGVGGGVVIVPMIVSACKNIPQRRVC